MVRLGLIQTKTYGNNKEGVQRVSGFLDKAGKKKTHIVCLPEQWLKVNEINDFDEEFVDFKEIAKKYEMTIIPGAFYQKVKQEQVICAPIIGPDGDIIGQQNKIHPFDYEKRIVKPGKEAKLFQTSCHFGIVICYDMVFPRVVETLVKKGAKVIFSPSRIVRRGISPWSTYVQARSLENRVPILAANVINKKFGGNSLVIDLYEKNKVVIPKLTKIIDEGLLVKNFNLSKYDKSRKARFSDSKEFR
ncbi:MAG: carbon-nitrogen hydrolase family protein [Nitrosopumilaceae archaeon]|nr:carbon-nitrogen hydrolase family protein [Nitrosopumilaceae archaeon]